LQAKTQRSQRSQLYSEERKEIVVLSDQYKVDSKKATKTIQTTKTLTRRNVSEGQVLMIDLTGKDILLKGNRPRLLTSKGSSC